MLIEKVCSKCKILKPAEAFHKSKSKSLGLASHCKDCAYEVRKEKYKKADKEQLRIEATERRERNYAWYYEYKETLTCSNCPESCPACLEFHHLRDKKYTVGRMIGVCSIEKIKAEIAKCIILCANCHRKLHRDEKADDLEAF